MKLDSISKKMIIIISAICGISIIASLVFYKYFDFIFFIIGVSLGCAFSIAKVFLLLRTVDKSLEKEKADASKYVSFHHLLRLFLTALVLIVSALISTASLWGAALGIFSFQISLYILKFTKKI